MDEALTRTNIFSWPSASTSRGRAALLNRGLVWGLAVLLSVYLGLSGGGYDIVVRSEIGLIVWWFLLLGVLIGLLPRVVISRTGWVAVSLLGGFLVWTWIGTSWSSSHELTLQEVCRLSTYLALFLIGLCALTPETARSLVNGLGCGIAVVCAAAVMSKLTPSLFPASAAGNAFYRTSRLSYPFNYADGVGEYAAIGLPLLLYSATGGRTLLGRAVSVAALQPLVLCLAMTVSRGGILATGVALVAFFALAPNRIPRLATLVISAAGTAVLMLALLHRAALRDALYTAPAGERHSMLAVLCVVVAGTGLVQLCGQMLISRVPRPGWLIVSRRGAQRVATVVLAVLVTGVIIAFASGTVGHLWHDFKLWQAKTNSNQYFRLFSLAGSHRYQYWQVAWKAFESSPIHGIGPGTFRFYWEQHTTHAEYILNAHSLWFETLAETGIVGWLLLAGFFALIVVGGTVRTLRTASGSRLLLATATACVLSFCAAASFDWTWQIGVVPMVALLLASATFATDRSATSEPRAPSTLSRLRPRALLSLAAIAGMLLIAIPLASAIALRQSQAAAHEGRLSRALADADTARAVEPGAASPYLQLALVYEAANEIGRARTAIRDAIAREPGNYQLWLVASRLDTESDHPRQALSYYQQARRLYPTSIEFGG